MLEVIERLAPGTIDVKRINRGAPDAPLSLFQAVENCNYLVGLGKGLGLSLPGLGGIDIATGNGKLILGFVWQLMRMDVLALLRGLGGPGKAQPKDSEIVSWANARVAGARLRARITGFNDPSLGTR